jgi:hypothetical protein
MLNVDGATMSSWEQDESQPYKRNIQKINSLVNKVSLVSMGIEKSDQ